MIPNQNLLVIKIKEFCFEILIKFSNYMIFKMIFNFILKKL